MVEMEKKTFWWILLGIAISTTLYMIIVFVLYSTLV